MVRLEHNLKSLVIEGSSGAWSYEWSGRWIGWQGASGTWWDDKCWKVVAANEEPQADWGSPSGVGISISIPGDGDAMLAGFDCG